MILIMLCLGMLAYQHSNAQVNVTVNIGAQPAWGPVGYDHVDYYYLPDVDAYYYVPERQFIYLEGSRWAFAPSLPPRYRGYNLYNGYKVVINEPKPYMHHTIYREKYKGFKGKRQVVIREKRYKNNGNGKGKAKGHHKH